MKIRKIYFDMDGVLADFDRGLKEFFGLEPMDQVKRSEAADDKLWEAVRGMDHFYDKLEMMEGAKELFDFAWENFPGCVEILTGIPKPRRGVVTAAEDKTSWAHRLLHPEVKVNAVFRAQKIEFAKGPDCVLIDDLKPTIRSWDEKGGTGIHHTSARESMEKLRNLLAQVD